VYSVSILNRETGLSQKIYYYFSNVKEWGAGRLRD
jgi:hypothetical protein